MIKVLSLKGSDLKVGSFNSLKENMTNKKQIKCLFGHHTFDERWTRPGYTILWICTSCRCMGFTQSDQFSTNKANVRILEENKKYFIIKFINTGYIFKYGKSRPNEIHDFEVPIDITHNYNIRGK